MKILKKCLKNNCLLFQKKRGIKTIINIKALKLSLEIQKIKEKKTKKKKKHKKKK